MTPGKFVVLWLCICSIFTVGKANTYYGNRRRHKDYDYVIVGAGSTGSVIAERLSEDKNVTVLLLEAGGIPPPESEIPLLVGSLPSNHETEWDYHTVPQTDSCQGLNEKRSFWSRYKALGGCSGHNYMVYNRGNPKDFDRWEKMGATGWNWKNLLPLFKKSENHLIKGNLENGYHGTSGFLTVSKIPYKSQLRTKFIEALKSLGFNLVDYNGPSQIGVSEIQVTQRNGRRCSTEKAFLQPSRFRPNLDILTNARALKIKFDIQRRARQVIYDQHNQTKAVTALKEIILSAGAIGSPQLLMLSGLGPKQHLRELNISLVADLPGVGENLQDHITAGGLVWKLNDSIGLVWNRDVNEKAYQDYYNYGKGPLTSPGTLENIIYANSKYQNFSNDWPDIYIQTASSPVLVNLPEYNNKDVTTLTPILPRPKSKGNLKLRSKDPYAEPIMDPRYFSEEEDLLTLIEGMKFCRKIMNTSVFQRFDAQPILEAVPDCQHLDWERDEYLECTARSLTYTYYHQCCTAKMGLPSDKSSVVDPELRVIGVTNLRVADASVMPVLPSANTNAACIMIGEKAAQMIRDSAYGRS